MTRAALTVFLLVLTSCSVFFGGDDKDDSAAGEQATRVPDSLLRSFVRTAIDQKGRISWQMKAREGRVFNDSNRIYVTDFILYSFAEDGSLRSTLRARRGIIDNNTGTIVARKLVVMRAENGRVLETEELFANNNDKIIYNEVLNRITQEDGTVMIGTHLWSHSDLKVFKLRGAQGEAPEGAEGGFFGDESSSSRSASSARSSSFAAGAAASFAANSSRTGTFASAAAHSSAGSRLVASAGSAGSRGFWPDLPRLGSDELDRMRTELAFPAVSRAGSSRASASSSAAVSSSSVAAGSASASVGASSSAKAAGR